MPESPYAASHKGLRNALGRFQLQARDAAAAEHDLAEHERLEALQARMFATLAGLDTTATGAQGRDFYLLVTEFHARYLEHILHEERVTEARLFARFTEDEVAGLSADLVAAVELPVLIASLKHIVPAQPLAEGRALLARLRGAPFYPELLEALRSELDADALEALVRPA